MTCDLQTLNTFLTSTPRARFDDLPQAYMAKVYSVPYFLVEDPSIGQLFITRYGWTFAEELLPSRWYTNRRYKEQGSRLRGSTGTVYHLPARPACSRPVELVVKFSRFAEETPIQVSTIPGVVDADRYADEVFNNPFEEFGAVSDLRRGQYGPPELKIRTKRPLAIYCPPARYPLWKLGRTASRFRRYAYDLARDQAEGAHANPVQLEMGRQYIMLFQWVRGADAEQLFLQGMLSEKDMEDLTLRVTRELHSKGFHVVDNKPKHFILRRSSAGRELLSRRGEWVYVLIDFELLKRTEAYTQFLRERHGRIPRPNPA